jgi:hypothetical protein
MLAKVSQSSSSSGHRRSQERWISVISRNNVMLGIAGMLNRHIKRNLGIRDFELGSKLNTDVIRGDWMCGAILVFPSVSGYPGVSHCR